MYDQINKNIRTYKYNIYIETLIFINRKYNIVSL